MKRNFDLRERDCWLTPAQIAAAMNVSQEAVRKRIRSGRLGQRMFGRLVVHRDELLTERFKGVLCAESI